MKKLSGENVVTLYKQATKENILLLLKVNYKYSEVYFSCITYADSVSSQEDPNMCRVKPLAGNWEIPFPNPSAAPSGMGLGHSKDGVIWTVTQATKKDLLLYLHAPQNPEMLSKIFNGTLKILEPKK